MTRRCIRAPVGDRDPYEKIIRIRLGILDDDIEIAVIFEDAGARVHSKSGHELAGGSEIARTSVSGQIGKT